MKIGFRYRKGKVGEALVVLDASFTIAGITLSLEGLAAGMPVAPHSLTPVFHLDGIGVNADKGAVAIGGALIRVSDDPLQFDGMLLVRGAGFSISALASFANLPSGPSFFAYAVLNRDLGGGQSRPRTGQGQRQTPKVSASRSGHGAADGSPRGERLFAHRPDTAGPILGNGLLTEFDRTGNQISGPFPGATSLRRPPC